MIKILEIFADSSELAFMWAALLFFVLAIYFINKAYQARRNDDRIARLEEKYYKMIDHR